MEKKAERQHIPKFSYFRRKKKKIALLTSLLSLVFLLGVNVYAWFAFVTKTDLSLSAKVIGWAVTFSDGHLQSDVFRIEVPDAYPGMQEFSNRIYVTNSGELDSEFRYEIDKIKLFGQNLTSSTSSQQDLVNDLESKYPFRIRFSSSADEMSAGGSLTFDTFFSWDYSANKYFKLDVYHEYDPTITYYTYNSGEYSRIEVTEENYSTLKSSLYMNKDDADSYFGIRCAEYTAQSGESCIVIDVKLSVEQQA